MSIWSSEIKELEQVSKSMKGTQPELEKELERLIASDDENMLLVYSRRCLEVIITELCEQELKRHRGTEPLQRIIDKLNKEEIVPHNIVVSMHNVNSMSTFGAHPKDFELKQVKPVLLNLTAILEWYLNYSEVDIQIMKLTDKEPAKKNIADSKPGAKYKNVNHRSRIRLLVGSIFIILLSVFIGITNLFSKHTLSDSIIVLPFTIKDSTQQYFAEGITVDVITELAKVKGISTLSWNTSATYTHSDKTLNQIADETDVLYAITGIIQREKDNIRINVALVNPRTGESIWAQSWDQELKLVFDIQKQIAKDVATELGVKLSPYEKSRIGRYQTRNFEAYDLFLQARAESLKMQWGSDFLHRSNQLIDDALKIDPDFPQALTLMANNLIDITLYEDVDPLEQAEKAKSYLSRSLALDPDYSDTYIVLGIVNYWLEWDFSEAKLNLEKGWELSNFGESPITQCFCGIIEFNMASGDFLRARSLLNKVEKIDPDYPYDDAEKFLISIYLNDTANLQKIIESYSGPEDNMANFYYMLGDYNSALEILLKSVDEPISYGSSFFISRLASTYYKLGMVEKSDSILNQLLNLSSEIRNIDYHIARIYAARDEKEDAIKWYIRAYNKHDLGLTSTLFDIDFKSLSDEPEIQNILKKIGIIQ